MNACNLGTGSRRETNPVASRMVCKTLYYTLEIWVKPDLFVSWSIQPFCAKVPWQTPVLIYVFQIRKFLLVLRNHQYVMLPCLLSTNVPSRWKNMKYGKLNMDSVYWLQFYFNFSSAAYSIWRFIFWLMCFAWFRKRPMIYESNSTLMLWRWWWQLYYI